MIQQNAFGQAVPILVDTKQFEILSKLLVALSAAGNKQVAAALNEIALDWQRETQKHAPVEDGSFRKSIAVIKAEPKGDVIQAKVGTNAVSDDGTPYPVFLEFGTKYIAGGAVLGWKFGDDPILDWAAKRGDTAGNKQALSLTAEGRGKNAAGRFVSKRAVERSEFMPPFRGSWQVIQDQAIKKLITRIKELEGAGKMVRQG
jgi:hypothetical protein